MLFFDHSSFFKKEWCFFMRFSRNFCFLLYDDSLNPEFVSVLSDFGEKTFVMYHDRDINLDGTQKKPHYHVMVMCRNAREENVVCELVTSCGGANGVYQAVNSKKSFARYLCHMDNPEKMAYNPEEVMCLGGADYLSTALTKTDKKTSKIKTLREILNFCRENKICYYCDLVDICLDTRHDWTALLIGTYGRVIRNYIQSIDFSLHRKGAR